MSEYNLPSFKKPVDSQVVINVNALWNDGCDYWFIAQLEKISRKKVSEIMKLKLSDEDNKKLNADYNKKMGRR